MDKLLTVIVPSFNVGKYLSKGLESLVLEDELLQALDVIVVNDGSTDNTSEVAHDFAKKYPRSFRAVDKGNGQYGSCINVGLKLAVGTYVKIMDGDDLFDMDGLSKLLRRINEFQKSAQLPDLILSDYTFVDSNGVRIGTWEGKTIGFKFPENVLFDVEQLDQCRQAIQMSAFAYKIELLRKIHYRQTEGLCYTDSEWILLPLAAVKNAVYIPGIVYLYLRGRNDQSTAVENWNRNIWMMAELAESLLTRMGWVRELASERLANLIYEYVYNMYRHVYVSHILYPKCCRKFSLRDFDMRLAQKDVLLYEKLELVSYGRRGNIRLVSLWRRRAIGLPLIVFICRMYTWMRRWI